MLVSIYGTSELFVNEYRNMLADRLLSITDYDTDKEVTIYFYCSHSL
jgi:anaphase-promoting complex subunit 2